MEGGCIVTDDEEIYHILLALRAHGCDKRSSKRKPSVPAKKVKTSLRNHSNFVLPGYNARPLEMSGAIGREQLKKLPDFIIQKA